MKSRTSASGLAAKFGQAAATNSGRVHVIPTQDGWAVKKEGAKRAMVVTTTKDSAVKAANGIKTAARIVVHKSDGTIQRNTLRK